MFLSINASIKVLFILLFFPSSTNLSHSDCCCSTCDMSNSTKEHKISACNLKKEPKQNNDCSDSEMSCMSEKSSDMCDMSGAVQKNKQNDDDDCLGSKTTNVNDNGSDKCDMSLDEQLHENINKDSSNLESTKSTSSYQNKSCCSDSNLSYAINLSYISIDYTKGVNKVIGSLQSFVSKDKFLYI